MYELLGEFDSEGNDLLGELGAERARRVGERVEVDLVRELEQFCVKFKGQPYPHSVRLYQRLTLHDAANARDHSCSDLKKRARVSVQPKGCKESRTHCLRIGPTPGA